MTDVARGHLPDVQQTRALGADVNESAIRFKPYHSAGVNLVLRQVVPVYSGWLNHCQANKPLFRVHFGDPHRHVISWLDHVSYAIDALGRKLGDMHYSITFEADIQHRAV